MKENNTFAFRNFYESVGANYPEEEIVYHSLRGRLREDFIRHRLKNLQGPLLDVGTGEGRHLRQYAGGIKIGIDISFNKIKKAIERDPEIQGKTLLYVVGNSSALPLRMEIFKSVLCSELLEHVLDPAQVLSEIERIMKPNGQLLVTTPNYGRKRPEWIETGILSDYGINPPTERGYFHTAYKPEELQQMIIKAELVCVEKGTLEKEVKYAARIPIAVYLTLQFINKNILGNRIREMWLYSRFERYSLLIYFLCGFLRANKFITLWVKNGVRSYVLATKHPNLESGNYINQYL